MKNITKSKDFLYFSSLLGIYYLQNVPKEDCRSSCIQKSKQSSKTHSNFILEMSGQIDLQKVLSVLVLNELSEPTGKEIQSAIQAISAKIPNRTPLSLVQKLFQESTLIAKKKKAATRGPTETTSINYRNFLKKCIAKSFYYHGFGYNSFLASMKMRHSSFHIEKKVYLIYSQGMVLQVYRALEAMMVRNRVSIKLKHYRKVQELCEWVLNYKKYIPFQAEALRKLINFVYSFDITPTISLSEARGLYEALQKHFQSFGNDQLNKINCLFEEIDMNFDQSEDLIFKGMFDDNDFEDFNIDFDENEAKAPITNSQQPLGNNFQLQDSDALISLK